MYKIKIRERHAGEKYFSTQSRATETRTVNISKIITAVHIILDDLQSVLSTRVGNAKFHAAMCTAPNTMLPSVAPKNSM